jgi:glucose/arabinose dehydrogenase
MVLAAAAPVPAPDDVAVLELVEDSFSSPLYVTAPEGDSRLFVVEQGGRVRIVVNDQIVGTYVDVGSLLPDSPGGEQGLLGMAFHPDFATNGQVYLAYTDSSGAVVVIELTGDPDANTISLGSRRTIIRVPHPGATNHNGGMILFGPDRYLYFGLGDGGGSGDPQGNGQNINALLGKILRIDVDVDDFPSDSSRNYGIPSDNPFVGSNGADEVWIYGVRNPWRFWIDPPTGRMYIADVGQGSREEVTVLEPGSEGSNLGWDRLEGSVCYPPGASCSSAGTVLPQVEYSHGSGSASVTGGMVYRGSRIPALQGTYFYADFLAGWVRSFRYDGTVDDHFTWDEFPTSLVSSFGVDGHGEMYVVSLGGSVWRIVGTEIANDEFFFYRSDGLFRFYDIRPDGTLPSPFASGSNYTTGWDSITAVDLDGDGQDEMFFYRDDGLYRYYNVRSDGSLPTPLLAGDEYTTGWDSITAVDVDGDGQDEMFFYRDDGLFRFYDVRSNGTLPSPFASGSNYTTGWDSITAVDLDGDGHDEMFFYRGDGLYRFYNVRPDGSLPTPMLAGDEYTNGWSAITAVDLDGDRQDEMFFYREDGLYRYYHVRPNGTLPSPLLAGDEYTAGWSSITAVDVR